MVIQVSEQWGGEAVPAAAEGSTSVPRGPCACLALFSGQLVIPHNHVADAGDWGCGVVLEVGPNASSPCSLPGLLGHSCPLSIVLALWSHAQSLLEACKLLETGAIGSF